MPLFSEYSLYSSPFSTPFNPYSPVSFRSGLSSTSNYSSAPSSNYGGGRQRYGNLLTTIVESGLTPNVPRRSPRTGAYVPPVKTSYTPKSSYTPVPTTYTPRSANMVTTTPYQRPMHVDTENIDVSTPRCNKLRRAAPPEPTDARLGDSDTRGTIKRGRTVVRMHTKHLKDNPAMDKRKRMTPGEKLMEKFLIKDKESERRKREQEEQRLREKEREEAAQRRQRLMNVQPVQPLVRTVTEDLEKDADKTPQNSDSGSDTETEEREQARRQTKKKKRKKQGSVKREPPVAPPRVKKNSFDLIVPIDIEEPKRPTLKCKERIKSVKCGGISKRGGTKKTIVLPPKSGANSLDDVLTPTAPQRGRKGGAEEKTTNNYSPTANKPKTEAKKSEPFGETMKSFSNFFLNFGKKTEDKKPEKKDELILSRQDSQEEEEERRKIGRGISNKDFKPKKSVKLSENKVSERLARFVEKKDYNRENYMRMIKVPSQNETILSSGVNAAIEFNNDQSRFDTNKIIQRKEESPDKYTLIKKEETDSDCRIEKAADTTGAAKDAGGKKPPVARSAQQLDERAGKNSVSAKSDEPPKPSAADEDKIPSAQNETKPAEEKRVDPKAAAQKEDSPTAKIGNGDKAAAESEQVERVCQNKDAAAPEDKDSKTVPGPPLESKENKKEEKQAAEKKFPWLRKAENLKSETDLKQEGAKTLLNVNKESQLAQAKVDAGKVNTAPDKKYPWLAKKQQTEKNEAASEENKTASVSPPAIGKKPWQIKAEAAVKSPGPAAEEAKVFLFDNESVDVIAGNDKNSTSSPGARPTAAETNSSGAEEQRGDLKLQKVPVKAIKSPTAAVEAKTPVADNKSNNSDTSLDSEASINKVAEDKNAKSLESVQDSQTVAIKPESPKANEPKAASPANKWAEKFENKKENISTAIPIVDKVESPKSKVDSSPFKKMAEKTENKKETTPPVTSPTEKSESPKVEEVKEKSPAKKLAEMFEAKREITLTATAKPVTDTTKSDSQIQKIEEAKEKSPAKKLAEKFEAKKEITPPATQKPVVEKTKPESPKQKTEEVKEKSPAKKLAEKFEAKKEIIPPKVENKKEITPPESVIEKTKPESPKIEEVKEKSPAKKLAEKLEAKKEITPPATEKPVVEKTKPESPKPKVEEIKEKSPAKKLAEKFEAKKEIIPPKSPGPLKLSAFVPKEPESPKKPDRAPKSEPTSPKEKENIIPTSPKEAEPAPTVNPVKQSLKMLQSMANEKMDSKSKADSNIILAKDSVKAKPLILRSRSSTVINKKPKAKLGLTKPPEAPTIPAPQKPLFMNNAFSKLQEAFNKQQQQQQKPQQKQPVKLKKMRAHTDLSAELLDSENEEEKQKLIQKSQSSGGLTRSDRHTVKFRADRVSTVRHQAMNKMSIKEMGKNCQPPEQEESDSDDDSDTETESGSETETSGSDTETEEGQTKVDRNSTSSEDSGFGSNQNSPQASTNSEDVPTAQLDVRDASSPNPRRLSTSLSTDSESGEDSHHRRYTPPARTIPRFRKYAVEDYQFLKVLGKGSFGKVLLAELKGTECYYAVKCLKKDVVLEDDDVECTLIERKVLALGTKHPYLCHLFCTFQTESHLFFVMEYLNGGDLMFHIQQSGRFEQARACFYAAEIVSGLRFLHKKGIVYRDLKLDNILLDYEGHVRIADFGMCKLQIYLDRTADTFCGTPDYMAPEIIKGMHYNQCVDWWSFGVLLFEMLVGQSPFNGCDEDDLFWSICNEQPYYPKYLSKEAQSILCLLLEKDSSKRLGTPDCPEGEVFEQPFFRSIDWGELERKELEPPFKPRVQHALDVQYFDSAFTKEAPKLTPVDKEILNSMDQTQFHGFSYTNPNACNE